MIELVPEDPALDEAADALLESIQVDDTNDVDRTIIRQEYEKVINTIKQQRLAKMSYRLMGETVHYQQAEGVERLAAKVAVSMQRQYPWLQAST